MKRIRIVPPGEVRIIHVIALIAFGVLFVLPPALAQSRASPPPPGFPQIFETSDYTIRVVEVVSGLANPWSLAFLPNGDMLVTERAGRLRIIRGGVLDVALDPDSRRTGRST